MAQTLRRVTVYMEPFSHAYCSHGTFLPVASRTWIPWDLLHVKGPFQCPRVEEPHPAPIACALPAVARRAGAPRKALCIRCGIVPVSPTGTKGSLPRIFWMGLCRQWHTGFLEVKLVYHPRSNRFQPTDNNAINNNCNKSYNMHKFNNKT